MSKKVKLKGKMHYPSLFNHSLIKVMVLHQLTKNNMTWDTFIEAALNMHITTSPSQQQTMSTQSMEVGSSRKNDEVPRHLGLR